MTTIDLELFAAYKMDLPPRTRCIANDLVSDVLVSSDVDEAGWAIEAEYPDGEHPDWLGAIAGGNPELMVSVCEVARDELIAELEGEG